MAEKLTVEFDVLKVDETFKDYGLLLKDVAYKGEETSYKAVIKDGDFVNFRSKRAVIIPNELIEEQIAPLIEGLGYERADQNAKIHKHRYFESFTKPDIITLKHDEKEETMKFGIILTNSIDGSIRTGIEGLTYRLICSNGAMAKDAVIRLNKSDMIEFAKNKDKIVKELENGVIQVNSKLNETVRMYENLMKEEFTEDRYNLLSMVLPEKYLKDIEGMVGRSLWNPYNELTQTIWHNSDITQIAQYGRLKQINRLFDL